MILHEHQKDALVHLKNGSVLWGGTGAGKTVTSLAYYKKNEAPKDLVVITTARKRDSLDWEREAAHFGIGKAGATTSGTMTVDSWNNINHYKELTDCFFIFDEQKVIGTGAWVKAFLKITKNNRWILLSATPGDKWLDYAPLFVANGFYRSISQFKEEHVVYRPYVRFPIVQGYRGQEKLERLRNLILVEMPYQSDNERYVNWLQVGYDVEKAGIILKKHWHPYEQRPFKDTGELFWILRKVVNSDPSRLETIRELLRTHKRMIVFYSWDYELDILRQLSDQIEVAEYNGHQKDPVPRSRRWVYLVQYMSGSEAWNCTETDAMVFYSLTSSYKIFRQAQGRIDRLDNVYKKLYYYVLTSNSIVDQNIKKRLQARKSFNERAFIRNVLKFESWL